MATGPILMPLPSAIPRLPLLLAFVGAAATLAVQLVSQGLISQHVQHQVRVDNRSRLLNAHASLDALLEQRALRMSDALRPLQSRPALINTINHPGHDELDASLSALSHKLDTEVIAVADAAARPLGRPSALTVSVLKTLRADAPLPTDTDNTDSAPLRRMVLVDWQLFQLVALPLDSPSTSGDTGHMDGSGSSTAPRWLVAAQPLARPLLDTWRQATGSDAGLLIRQPGGAWHLMVGTLPQASALPDATWSEINPGTRPNARRATGLTATSTWLRPTIDATEYDARFTLLTVGDPSDTQRGQAGVIALASAADTPGRASLLHLLLGLSLASSALIGATTFVVALGLWRSLRQLTSWARNMHGGHYKSPPKITGLGEVRELARSLDALQKSAREREAEIMHLAYRDPLTGLPNREKLRIDLRKAVDKAIESKTPCSLLIMDLDRFKHVNDVLGHGFGDRLLRLVAQRLRDEVLDSSMPLARLGGDEFAVLLKRADAPQAKKVAKHILHALERPLQLDDHTIDLAAGIGIASCPAHSSDADELMSRAEVAMYAAKHQQNGITIFQPTLDAGSQASLSLLSELRRAVDDNQLRLFLQPKVNLASGQVVGAEALVRWQHPERGMVPPTQFIPFAEQTGFIRTLSLWMVERTARIWHDLHHHGLTIKISVNLSTRDLLDQDLTRKLENVLQQYGVPPGAIVLEITESAMMDDPDRALQTLASLHRLGLRLSIDDFGTGYSSLAYLKRLPVDELKIDKSFVMKMESDLDDAKIVRSTIDLAHNLGLSVVAEGIENEKTWKLLAGLACDEAQGYFIARPMPADEFFDWARRWQTPHTDDVRLSTDFANMI